MEVINISDFYTKLQPVMADVNNSLPNIHNTISAFLNINKGCGCQREARINHANNTYETLFSCLIDVEKTFLKTSFNNETITFKNGDAFIGEF